MSVWITGLVAVGVAAGADCVEIDLDDVVSIVPPAVIVLGERHGTSPDLWRARRVVQRLHANAPVTLAIEVLPSDRQQVLDRFADGELALEALPGALAWSELGWAWGPYAGLVTSAIRGIDVLAVGPTELVPPAWKPFPVPQGYASVLLDAVAGPPPPKVWEQRVARAAAWADFQIAEAATRSWDGKGYLVILADRGRVEGGLGVPWQVEQRKVAPVSSFVLAWGATPACYAGDQVWRRGVYDRLYPRFEVAPAGPAAE